MLALQQFVLAEAPLVFLLVMVLQAVLVVVQEAAVQQVVRWFEFALEPRFFVLLFLLLVLLAEVELRLASCLRGSFRRF
jgi:hypothetical protein